MQQRAEVTPKPERIKNAAEYLRSGMTMTAWSKERQINRFTLHNWVKEYRQEEKPEAQCREWLELNVNAGAEIMPQLKEAEETAGLHTPIRIIIGDAQIEVTTAFDERALVSVIKAVKYQC